MSDRWRGALCGVGAAALFGLSAPVAKQLVRDTNPIVLASLLYLGAALALWLARTVRGSFTVEAPLRRSDLPILGCIAITGGMLGPVLLLFGLARVSAVTGSLLLNLEAPLTILLALALFGEHIGRRATVASALILCGAALLAGGLEGWSAETVGVLLICAACLTWALDNNLTQRLSLRDPLAIVSWKATAAGLANLLIAATLGAPMPSMPAIVSALLLGALSYGVSIVLDTYALRLIGAAREAAFFATAPFFGAGVAVVFFGDVLGARQALATLLMIAGMSALLFERHAHVHNHQELTHEHVHTHDEHHQHGDDLPLGEVHSHVHTHAT
ncbi:MAG TPA: EamA family transporter, partial [Candidatus Acidoferrales bacterium]|nr:EamA family transporter [Candidatus Acidoferrales bacterium]